MPDRPSGSREKTAFEASILRRIALAVLVAKVLLVPVFFDPSAYVVFAHPKALAGHALGFILLGLLVAAAIRFGPSILPMTPLHFAVMGVVAVSIFATVFALDRQIALFGTLDRQLGLASLLDHVVLYFAIVSLVRSRSDLLAVAAAAATGTLLVLAYALVQRSGLDPLSWRSGSAADRPFAMLGNPGNLAQVFGTVAAAPIAALVAFWPRLTPTLRAILAGWALLAVLGAILSGARAVGLGLSAAAALMGALAIHRAPRSARVYAGVAAAAVLAIGLALGAREIAVTGIDLINGRIPTTQGSLAGRVDLYRVALAEVAERPLSGVGPDNYVAGYPEHRLPDSLSLHESDAPQTSPHSWPLKVATDSGALGLAAHGALVGVGSWLAVRRRGLALVGLAVVASFLATGMVSIGDVGTEWLLWAGLSLIALPADIEAAKDRASDEGRRRVSRAPRAKGPRAGLAWAAVALGVVASLFQFNALEASRAASSSRQARLGTQPLIAVAVASGRRAVELDSGRSEYWHELGLALAAAEEFRAAEDAFDRAAEMTPYQAVFLINLAKAQIEIGRTSGPSKLDEALRTARRAAATDPHVADVQYTLALALFVNGQFHEAAAASERAWALRSDPGAASGFEVAVRAYRQIGRPVDAERWARAATVALGSTIEWQLVVAHTLLEQDRVSEALAQVEAALALVPNHPEALALREAILSGESR